MPKDTGSAQEDHQARVDSVAAMVAQVHKEHATQARRHALAGRVAVEASKTDPVFATALAGHLDKALVHPAHRSMFDLPPKTKP